MTVKKATPKTAVKSTKPQFGEVGFRFPVMAEIVQVSTDEDLDNYPVMVKVEMGNWEDYDYNGKTGMSFSYPSWKDFKDLYAKCDPKFLKTRKQDELKQAQALVAKLTKELAELK